MATTVTRRTAPVIPRLRQYLAARITVDTRSLALFRVLAGILIVADVLLRSRNRTHFYSDEGVVPRSMAMETSPDYAISIFYLTGDPTVILLLLIVQLVFAIALILGYRTRFVLVVSFLFVISLDHRNPFVLSYADTLFRLLLFWAIFLPLGERWSIDAVHREGEARESITSIASFLILFQMVFMYIGNGINKTESDDWMSGEAAALVLGLDNITFLLGEYVRNFPTLLTYGGLIWVGMLLSAWLLILLPGRPRLVLVAMFAGVHLSFALTVRIGAFPWVAILGLIPFLQAQFWSDLNRLRSGVNLRIDRGLDGKQLINRLEPFAGRFPDLRVTGARIDRIRSGAFSLTMAIIVVSILITATALAANAGTLVAGDSDEREEELERILDNTTAVKQVNTVAESLHVQQRGWTIFAPNPRTHDRYHVFPAKTDDGQLLDVHNERTLTWERPRKQLHLEFDTYRERFYMSSIRENEHEEIREHLAEYYCEQWAERAGVNLTHVNMYQVVEDVTLETLDAPEHRDRSVFRISRHACGDHEPQIIGEPDIYSE